MSSDLHSVRKCTSETIWVSPARGLSPSLIALILCCIWTFITSWALRSHADFLKSRRGNFSLWLGPKTVIFLFLTNSQPTSNGLPANEFALLADLTPRKVVWNCRGCSENFDMNKIVHFGDALEWKRREKTSLEGIVYLIYLQEISFSLMEDPLPPQTSFISILRRLVNISLWLDKTAKSPSYCLNQLYPLCVCMCVLKWVFPNLIFSLALQQKDY